MNSKLFLSASIISIAFAALFPSTSLGTSSLNLDISSNVQTSNPSANIFNNSISGAKELPNGYGNWKFNAAVDLDWRDLSGEEYANMRQALDEAFKRVNVSKDKFEITVYGVNKYGKSFPVQWDVTSGSDKGAQVNIDDPRIVPANNGPKDPHVGYQTSGKRNNGAVRGHIILKTVPVCRGVLSKPK